MRSGIGLLHLWCDMPLVYRVAACDITFGITSTWEKVRVHMHLAMYFVMQK